MNMAAVSMWCALPPLESEKRRQNFYYKTVLSAHPFVPKNVETNQDNIFRVPAFHGWIYFCSNKQILLRVDAIILAYSFHHYCT